MVDQTLPFDFYLQRNKCSVKIQAKYKHSGFIHLYSLKGKKNKFYKSSDFEYVLLHHHIEDKYSDS
jgi:hypothetical protein